MRAANERGDDRLKRFMSERGLDPGKEYSRDDWNAGAVAYDEKKLDEAENRADENRRAARPDAGSRAAAAPATPTS